MFKNLKNKLKKAIFGVSKKIEEPEGEVEEQEEVIEEEIPEEPEEEKVEEVVEEPAEEEKEEPESEPEPEVKPEPEEIPVEEPEEVIEEEITDEPVIQEEIPISDEDQKLIEEAQKEAEEEIKKHKEVLKKEGEGFFKKLFKKEKKEEPKEEPAEKPKEDAKPEPKKATLMERLRNKKISEKDFDGILWDLELALVENDVAKEVTEKITGDIKKELIGSETSRQSVEQIITDALKKSVEGILEKESVDVLKLVKEKSEKPHVILFFGFNGTGKTMTIGKFAKLLKDNGLSCVMAAGDTFRAAAIEQLEVHAKNLDVPIIKQERGSDSAAVIFDAIAHAKSKGIDVVLADTAGRSDTNINLMDELKKVVRVNKPDLKIFVADSLTGNDAADQAKVFHDAVGIDASVLTKVDCDAKGGACLSVSYMTDAPIIYIGTGQEYGDMEPFKPEWFLEKVF
jgi:fused signal recognition particle receptor